MLADYDTGLVYAALGRLDWPRAPQTWQGAPADRDELAGMECRNLRERQR